MAAVNPILETSPIEDAWQSIAGLRLRPNKSIQLYHHVYRGIPWLIISDQQSESYYRCNGNVEPFLELLDGSRTVEQAFEQSGEAPTSDLQQQDIVYLIANLRSAGLLDEDEYSQAGDSGRHQQANLTRWQNPFAVRFPLFNPDRFLKQTAHLTRPLFSPAALYIWVGLVIVALATTLLNWQGLVEHGAARFSDPKNLLWFWLLYPLVKAFHELGHAYATRIWGGKVNQMGIMILVLFPVPYVDSSAAHQFSSKNRRLTVCAAGIMVEAFLASVALLVWANTGPGLVQDLAFDIVIIGAVSTLAFNANPLLRFDGYYVLSELIEIPNLATRSDRYLGYLLKKYLLAIPNQRSPVTAAGEVKWLVSYGICARIYRVFITLYIAFWVAGKFLIIGVLLALWALIGQLLLPMARGIWRLIPLLVDTNRLGRFAVIVSVSTLVILSSLFMPVGQSTYAEGMISLPENAFIRAGANGIVTSVHLEDGDTIEEGGIVLKLENLALEARLESLRAQLEETRARHQQAFLEDRTQADILKVKIAALEADLEDLHGQLDSLVIVGGKAGILSLPTASDLPGRYVERGDVIGHIVGQGGNSALVVVPQANIDMVRQRLEAIEVRLGSQPGKTFSADFLRELPQGTDRLPHRILGSASGGLMAVDARDESGTQLVSKVFMVEIGLPADLSENFLGNRLYVRFIHPEETLGKQLIRSFNQLLLQPPFNSGRQARV
jgi:putative peptide zinc metalloprotease protein